MAINKSKSDFLFSSLFKNTVDGIFLLDGSFQVKDTDASFEKTLKLAIEKHNSFSFSSLFFNQEEFAQTVAVLKKKKRIQNHEVALKTKTGKQIYAELNIIKSQGDHGEDIYIGFFFDVSKRKKAEKELLQAEKRLAAGKLSRILAHEVRNPLTNVQLALEQLKDEFADEAEEAELYFDVIKRNSERIGNLISALLNSSRPRTATLSSVNLNNTVKEAIELIKDRLTLKDISLNLSLDETMPVAMLDSEQLKIALVNIMVNAIEAMKEGHGVLQVETKSQKRSLILRIKDNGLGMSPEETDQLFEPFFSKKRKGTGLGLTTVQNIIHAHNGSIKVNSKPKRGTIFTLKLPI